MFPDVETLKNLQKGLEFCKYGMYNRNVAYSAKGVPFEKHGFTKERKCFAWQILDARIIIMAAHGGVQSVLGMNVPFMTSIHIVQTRKDM